MSSKPLLDKNVGLASGPTPLAISCVSVPLRVGQFEFPVNIMPDRSILIPEWVPVPERTVAATFATQFERGHRVVVHELLKIAGEAIAGHTASTISYTISTPPTLSEAQDLVFRSTRGGEEEIILHVSAALMPSQFHTNQDGTCNANHLFAAYDAALDYAQEHLAEIDDLGFDTTVLKMSVRDWTGYKERLRLV